MGSAQAHLRNQGVGAGDLFLFFGLFRSVVRTNGRWKFEGPNEHRLFGWLQIGRALCVGDDPTEALSEFPWLEDHPHAEGDCGWPDSNTIYVAREELALDGVRKKLPGWGLFRKASA